MKKFLAMVMTVAMVISMMTVVSFAAGVVPTIEAGDVTVGENVTVNVVFPATTNGVSNGSFELVYDNTKLQVVDMVAGNLIAGKEQINTEYSSDSVYLTYAGSSVEEGTKAGYTWATVTFKSIATGEATFSFRKFTAKTIVNKLPKSITIDSSFTKTITVKAAGPSYTNGYYDLKTNNADNTASVSYFGTVDAATLYVATYKAVGTGYELAGVATKDIAAGTVAELTTVTTDAVEGGNIIKAFLWDANLNTVTWSVLPE